MPFSTTMVLLSSGAGQALQILGQVLKTKRRAEPGRNPTIGGSAGGEPARAPRRPRGFLHAPGYFLDT